MFPTSILQGTYNQTSNSNIYGNGIEDLLSDWLNVGSNQSDSIYIYINTFLTSFTSSSDTSRGIVFYEPPLTGQNEINKLPTFQKFMQWLTNVASPAVDTWYDLDTAFRYFQQNDPNNQAQIRVNGISNAQAQLYKYDTSGTYGRYSIAIKGATGPDMPSGYPTSGSTIQLAILGNQTNDLEVINAV
ncbi:MAG: hypothetical protein ACPGU9_09215 [Flavobacteriaceae bacterium]